MIVSASVRTDIPAFYGEWFRNRFRAGYCLVANPFSGQYSRVSLRHGVDGFVFWTRNPGPFLPVLAEVKAAGFPFLIQYTVTGYPQEIETSVIEAERSIALIRQLAELYGRRAVVWRYDPILLSDLTPPDWHIRNFARLAAELEGAVDEVVVSFVQNYRKTARNLAARGRKFSFSWRDPDPEEKTKALARLTDLAAARGMRLSICSQPELPGEPARCIDARRLSDLAGHPVPARTKGTRPGCLCAESRDIGAYESCPHGCAYCYAVNSRAAAKARLRAHDPLAEALILPPEGISPMQEGGGSLL